MVRTAQGILVLGLACLAAAAGAQGAPDAMELVRRAEEALRGDTTTLAVRMTVVSSRDSAKRVVAFHAWDDRLRDRSFIRILSPAKDAGTSFLRLPPNVWKYVPRVQRITRIPPERMLEVWLRSDFSLDDWLHESSELDDYQLVLLRSEQDADGRQGVEAHVVELRPREGAPVVWGRIESWIGTEKALPLRRDFYDPEGARVRTLRFHDFREVDGRSVPHRWVMTPAGEAGRETRVELESIAFDAEIDDSIFSTRNLKEAVKP